MKNRAPKITDIQARILAFLRSSPEATIANIQHEIGYDSKNSVYWHIRRLEAAGLLVRPTVTKTGWKVKIPHL